MATRTRSLRAPVRRALRAAHPDRIAARYASRLVAIVRRMYDDDVVAELVRHFEREAAAYDARREDDERTDAGRAGQSPFEAFEGRLGLRWGALIDRQNPAQTALPFGTETGMFQKDQYGRTVGAVLAVDPLRSEPWLDPVMRTWSRVNAGLIRSLGPKAVRDVRVAVDEAWRSGRSTGELQRMLRERFGVTSRRAELIARDQVGKLNGGLSALRQAAAGVEEYIWRTARDERVRQRHADRDGERFSWASPPDDGHPGHPIQCRCTPEPVLDDLLDEDAFAETGTIEHAERVRDLLDDVVDGLAVPGMRGAWLDAIRASLPTIATIRAALSGSAVGPEEEPPEDTPPEQGGGDFAPPANLEEARARLRRFGITFGDPATEEGLDPLQDMFRRNPAAMRILNKRLNRFGRPYKRDRLLVATEVLRELERLERLGLNPMAVGALRLMPRAKRNKSVGGSATLNHPSVSGLGRTWSQAYMALRNTQMAGDSATWRNQHGRPMTVPSLDSEDRAKWIGSAFRHELGHVLTNDEVLRRWRATGLSLSDARKLVSDYAGTKPEEFIAEAFAMFTAEGYERGTLPAELEQILDGMLKDPAPALVGGAAPSGGLVVPPPGMRYKLPEKWTDADFEYDEDWVEDADVEFEPDV